MKKLDILIIVIMLVGAFWTFALNEDNRRPVEQLTPCELVDQTQKADKFVSTDELARKIMSNDPSVILIDLRPQKEFSEYSLPGAINIPIENLLDKKYVDMLNQKTYTNIFFSNSSDLAAKAWMITTRLGYQNNFILQGGLNYWVETILLPKKPDQTAVNADFIRYNFRKAASAYFMGGSVDVGSSSNSSAPKAPIKRRKKEAAGGGCD